MEGTSFPHKMCAFSSSVLSCFFLFFEVPFVFCQGFECWNVFISSGKSLPSTSNLSLPRHCLRGAWLGGQCNLTYGFDRLPIFFFSYIDPLSPIWITSKRLVPRTPFAPITPRPRFVNLCFPLRLSHVRCGLPCCPDLFLSPPRCGD